MSIWQSSKFKMSGNCHLYVPPFAMLLILAINYFLYTVSILLILKDLNKLILYFVFFNILFILLVWSFLSTMYTPPALVPEQFSLSQAETNLYNETAETHKAFTLQTIVEVKRLDLQTRTVHGVARYCKICNLIKPDRAHHCSKCGICILRMDHHCPWLKNCIGFSNHKFFILTLFYAAVFCIYYALTLLEYFMDFWSHYGKKAEHLMVVVGFFIAALFGSINGICFIFHLSALLRNETNIENLYRTNFVDRRISYNLGSYKNFKEIFGNNWALWLLPVFTSKGNGYRFPYVLKTYRRHHSNDSISLRSSYTSQRNSYRSMH